MKLKLYKRGIALITMFAVFGVSACATIISGRRQNVAVASIPSGADVIVKDVNMGRTPATLILNRKDKDIVIRFEKKGYKPVEVTLERKENWWIVANALWGLIGIAVGFAVDFGTGSAYRLTPKEVEAVLEELQEQGVNLDNNPDRLVIVAVDMEQLL